MKKIHLVLLSLGITLLACVLVMGGILLRQNYCHVTFICEEGCQHTAWQKKGESADLSALYKAHADDVEAGKEPMGVFRDEERLLYYFEETLCDNQTTYYLGAWHKVGYRESQAICFRTHLGDIMMYVDSDSFPQKADAREVYWAGLQERFYQAYEALGGNREDVLYYTYRTPDTKIAVTYTLYNPEDNSLYKIFWYYTYIFWDGFPTGSFWPSYYYEVEYVMVSTEPLDYSYLSPKH